jgi:hypothetical protein
MNTTQAKRTLEAAVKKAGGWLEEDNARPPMRCFQLVAPDGRVWTDNGCKHIRLDLDSQRRPQAMTYNAAEVDYALRLLEGGHRKMTEQEAFDCDETPA